MKTFIKIAMLVIFGYYNQAYNQTKNTTDNAIHKTVQKEKLLAHVENGFIDKTGALAIKLSDHFHGSFSNGLARVWTSEGKWGYIDTKGSFAIQPTYDFALPFSDGLAAVNIGCQISNDRFLKGRDVVWANIEGGKWNYIDHKGKVIIETPYTEVRSFHDGLAPVKIDNAWGYIDKAGKIVVPPTFEDACELNEGMGAVLLGHKWGFIDKTGKQIVECTYCSRVELMGGQILVGVGYSDGLAWIDNGKGYHAGKKWGVIDTSGKVVIDPQYDDYGSNFCDGLSAVKINGKACIIDNSGKILAKTDFEQISEFSEGIASFMKAKKWGAIDRTGKIIIEPQFINNFKFSQGLATVMTEVETAPQRVTRDEYYIDKSGSKVINTSVGWNFQNVYLGK